MSAAHDHSHGEHLPGGEHAHRHAHAPAHVHVDSAVPVRSLLLLSFGQRLVGAAILVAALWAAVFWALG